MEKIDFSFRKKTKRWLGLLTFCLMLCMGQMGFAQVLNESFDNTGLPSGWTQEHVSGTFDWSTVTANGNSTIFPRTGTHMAEFRNTTSGTKTKLITPSLDLTSLTTPVLTFYYANVNWAGDIDELRVFYRTNASGSWVQIGDNYINEKTSWEKVELILPNHSADYYIAFEATSNWARGLNLDDVTIEEAPSCFPPTGLTASNITINSADLSWTSEGSTFDISWGTGTFDAEDGTIVSLANGGTLSGLAHTTAYQYYVRQNCGIGDVSLWVGPYSFTTTQVPATSPYMDDFSTNQFSFVNGTQTNKWAYGSATGNPANAIYISNDGGVTNAYTTGSASVVQAYRDIAVPSGATIAELGFDWKGMGESSYDYLRVWLVPTSFMPTAGTQIPTGAGRVQLGTYYNQQATWQTYFNAALDVSSFAGQTMRLVFEWRNDTSTGTQAPIAIDNVLFEIPSCPAPAVLAASNITTNSADLSWTSEGSTFDISWGTGTFDAEDGTIVSLANGATLSGLSPQTTYQFYVRQDCGGDISSWVGPYTFTTLAAPASIPWLEPFAGTTFPANWSNTSSWSVSTSTTIVPGAEGSYLYKNIYGSTDGAMFSTLRMGLVSAGDILNFNYGLRKYSATTTASGTISIEVSTDNGVTYSPFQTITHSDDVAWTSSEQFDLSAYAGENIRIRITATIAGTSDDYYLGFDNFYVGQPITCEAPSALTATNITTNTADLSWTSEGSTFDISWGAGAFDAEDGTIVSLANGGTLSGLTAQTTYQYYVRQNCGIGDFSLWAGPYSFTTLCDTVTEFTQNWDSVTTPALPNCYTKVGSLGSVNTQSSNASSGSNTLYMYGSSASNEPTLALQQVSNAGAGTHWLRFKLRTNFTVGGKLQVGYLTDPTDAASFVMLEEFIADSTTYTEHTCAPGTAMGSYTTLALRAKGTPANSMLIDDLSWEIAPSCLAPTSLTASDITANAANLSWSSEGSLFDIEWAEGTFDQGSGTLVSSVANPHTLGGLMPNTTYSYYVRQDCAGEASDWSGPYSFTTACEAFDLPYSQDFEGVTAPSLPSCTSIETLNGNPWRTSSSAVTGMTGNKLNYTYHAPGTGTADAWFYTPGLNLEAGKNYAISYKYGNNSTSFTESMRVAYGTSAMASAMNEVLADHNAIISTGVSENEVFFTVAEDGVYYFGFQSYSIAYQNQLYVDDILIRELGDDCTGTPDAGIATISMDSGISGSTADFAVTGYENDAEGLSFDWEFSVDNGVTWSSTGASDNEASFTITGTIGTVFQVRYAVTCSFSESTAYSNVVTFTVSQPLEYCTPTYTDFTYDDRLSVVTTTEAVLDLNYSNSTTISQHFDGTATILEATPGMQFTLNTTYVGGEQTVGIWIDWENNNTFDDLGNRIALNHSNSLTQSFTVTIPSDATPGDYRLRVRGSYGNHTADGDAFACNSKSWGSSVDFTIRVAAPCSAEWTGAVSTDWNTAGNWCDNTVPSNTSDVTINSETTNFPVITTDVNVASITVATGASVTVNGSLTTGNITVANGGNFVVSNGASLMQAADAVNTGNITVHRNSNPMFRLDYTLWSSPVSGQNLQAFSPETLPTRIYKYDAATDSYDNTYPENTFLAGQGYLFRSPNNWVINDGVNTAQAYSGVFTGVANNANIPVSVVSNAFNGLGNPYPSAIDAEELFAANSTIQAIYFWTNANPPVDGAYATTTNNWASWTTTGGTSADGSIIEPNGEIAVGQGFIAQVNGNTSVTFNNDMRIGGAGMFFRAMQDERHRFWLNLYTPDLMLNQILIGYVSGATQGEDNQIDGEMFGYGESALYSLINNSDKQFVIQGRSLPFEATDVVPLGFKATTAGEFTVSLANFDGLFAENQTIYLKDNVTLAVHNLKEGAYSFISEEGTFDTRFEVVYQTTMSVDTPNLDNNWIVFKQGGQFQIMTQGFDMKSVQVFDMLGRTVYASAAEGTTHTIARIDANQVLIVKVTTADGEVLTKKVQN